MTNRTHKLTATVSCILLAGVLSTGAAAQQKRATGKTDFSATDVLPLTCAQAWTKSNKTYEGMLSIIRTLARVSLANRDLTFPNTREAGSEAGRGIAADCKADPDALLFAIVDKYVRQVSPSTPPNVK